MKNILLKKNGFSLIETIIAITVIGLVITATASLTQSSLRAGRSTINQFSAYLLAQEGLEIARNLRDSNWLKNLPWRDGFKSDGIYVISSDTRPFRISEISNIQQAEKIDLSNGRIFSRYLEIKTLSQDSIRILCAVNYSEKGTSSHAELSAELTDWKKGPI